MNFSFSVSRRLMAMCNDGSLVGEMLRLQKTECDKYDYLDYDTESGKLMISFLPNNRKKQLKSDDPWTSKLRQVGRPGTVLKNILTDRINQKAINNFLDGIKSRVIPPKDVVIKTISREHIWDIYTYHNYLPESGNSILGKSCMRKSDCVYYIDFYRRNSRVSGVALYKDEYITARALIWEALEGDKEVTVMDRVYAYSDVNELLLREWAMKNCDYIVSHSKLSFTDSKTGNERWLDLKIPLDSTTPLYPYLDTFYYLEDNHLYNIKQDHSLVRLELREVNGKFTSYCRHPDWEPGKVQLPGKGWVDKTATVPYKNSYILQESLGECSVCKQQELISNLTAVRRDDDTTAYLICGRHDVVVLDDKPYQVCFQHRQLNLKDCPPCVANRRCAWCGARPSPIRVDNFWICDPCGVPKECPGCLIPSVRNPAQTHCSSCRLSLRSCDSCGERTGNIEDYETGSYCESCAMHLDTCSTCSIESIGILSTDCGEIVCQECVYYCENCNSSYCNNCVDEDYICEFCRNEIE